MKIERFQQLAEAFGGDLSRWPEAERQAAGALLRASDEAQGIIAAELALDAALDRAAVKVDDLHADRAAAAIFARLDVAAVPSPAAAVFSARWPAGFLAAMALVGVLSGALTSPSSSPVAVSASSGAASIVDVAESAGYYSTRFLAAWAQ